MLLSLSSYEVHPCTAFRLRSILNGIFWVCQRPTNRSIFSPFINQLLVFLYLLITGNVWVGRRFLSLPCTRPSKSNTDCTNQIRIPGEDSQTTVNTTAPSIHYGTIFWWTRGSRIRNGPSVKTERKTTVSQNHKSFGSAIEMVPWVSWHLYVISNSRLAPRIIRKTSVLTIEMNLCGHIG